MGVWENVDNSIFRGYSVDENLNDIWIIIVVKKCIFEDFCCRDKIEVGGERWGNWNFWVCCYCNMVFIYMFVYVYYKYREFVFCLNYIIYKGW